MRATLWKAHRWMGLITCVAILLWGLSGLTHPIMTRLQPTPASFMPPKGPSIDIHGKSPAAWLTDAGVKQVHRLSSVTWRKQVYWLAHETEHQEGLLIHAQTGQIEPQGERKLAQSLASHYTGRPESDINDVALVSQFDGTYLPVNRLLPVWRVRFEGDQGLVAYIDTRQMRLATLIDDRRELLSQWFRWAHNWSFLDRTPTLQLLIMSSALLVVMASSLTGLYFWWVLRTNTQQRLATRPFTRWHRRLGLLVSITSMCFGSSALFHLWMTPSSKQTEALSAQIPVNPAVIDEGWHRLHELDQPAHKLHWIAAPFAMGWSVQSSAGGDTRAQVAALSDAHQHAAKKAPHSTSKRMFVDIKKGLSGPDESQLAIDLAKSLMRSDLLPAPPVIGTPTLVTQFEGEYGFLNKRLPVWRVAFATPKQTRLYVETSTNTLAAKVNQLDAIEGSSFSTLHKWHIGPINKDLRDALSATFALLHVIVALLGFCMFMRWR